MDSSENFSFANETGECLLPLLYAPPLSWYVALMGYNAAKLDMYEYYHKQFYYNRCIIAGPNGKLKLIIPVLRNGKSILKDTAISYRENWQILHWRSLEAAYRRSPYFEFYEPELAPLYSSFKPIYLHEWNTRLLKVINKFINLSISISFTDCYILENNSDFRFFAEPNARINEQDKNTLSYRQVFEEKNGFFSNLSIFDLLFCEGPYAKKLLMRNEE